jgi:deazaflavin-dependent oxidoreductase (nitroreductase family)
MSVCVMAALGWGAIPVMTNLNITFLRPARAADLIARARIVRRGARLFYLECWLSSDGDEQPCAHITSTYRVARNGGGEGEKLPRGETAMTNENAGLGWSDLLKMGAEVRADDGPGSKDWHAAGSETQRVNALYMQALRANQGKVPGELSVVPSLIITTVGARSGEKRSVPLACQVIDGRLVIVASMGGSVRNPPWFHNLVKNPRVVVEKDGETFEATAVVTEGEDRRYLYDKVAEALPAFKEYQERTARVIPVIELKRSA